MRSFSLPSVLSAFFISFLTITGCSLPKAEEPGTSDQAFEAFTSHLFQEEVASTTIGLHYTLRTPEDYGVVENSPSFGVISFHSAETLASIENLQATLHTFETDRLTPDNQLTFQVLSDYLETAAQGAPYLLYQEPLSPVTGIHAQLPVLLAEFPFYSEADLNSYLALLGEVGNYFDSIVAFEQTKSEHGLFMPDYQAEEVIAQCRAFVSMGETNYLCTTFDERTGSLDFLTEDRRAELQAENRELVLSSVLPAYEALADNLQSLKGSGTNEQGLCYYPDGKKYYNYLVRQSTGLEESVPQLQELAGRQIAEDLAALQQASQDSVSQQTSGPSSLLDTLTPSAILADLRSKTPSAFPEIPQVTVNVKYVPEAMQDYLSPAFYLIPPIDSQTEHVIYLNPGQAYDGLNLYTTLAHEGWPGHLYQTVYFASSEPDPLRSILDYGGYVEGWATYAEMMSYYLAPLSSRDAALLQKNNSIILGLYACADMGIHYDGWSRTDTIRFFKNYGITDIHAVGSIYELIIGTPANYLKYYLGYVKFLDIKRETASRLGDDFSQLEFHKAVLDAGPAPFSVLEQYVNSQLPGSAGTS